MANLCRVRSHSLAEVTAYLRLPLGVTRVIVADMAARGLVTVHEPLPFDPAGDPRAPYVLERVGRAPGALTGLDAPARSTTWWLRRAGTP